MSYKFIRFSFLTILLCSYANLFAQLTLPEVFSDDMILQRGKHLPIWGKASPGATVEVKFQQQVKTSKADADGNWMVSLDPLKANAIGNELFITAEVTKIYKNVLVGDVWLCSGQSNMEYPLDRTIPRYPAPKKGEDLSSIELLKKDKPSTIRYLFVEKQLNKYPKLPSKGWFTNSDTLLRKVSAIGYFFAKEIQAQTDVPIGIISTSWGGTRIEQWTPEWAYATSDSFKEQYQKDGQKIDGMRVGQTFKGLVQPLVPYAVKGVLWYQGESNAMIEDQLTYPEKFNTLIQSWRKLFQNTTLPFYTVQIAPYRYSMRKDPKTHAAELLPEFWEAQRKCLAYPNVDMVVISDLLDNLSDIHPSYKWEVAHRLALQVRKKEYGEKKLIAHGPTLKRAIVKSKIIKLKFNNAHGLQSHDGKPLNWFSIAGEDGQWVAARAEIKGDHVEVSTSGISKPSKIRFAWNEIAQPNLINTAKLPGIPFQVELK